MIENREMETLVALTSLESLIREAETATTYEVTNIGVSVSDVKEMLFQYASLVEFPGFDYGDALSFISSAQKGLDYTVGPYDASYYWKAFQQARNIIEDIQDGHQQLESRQLVIGFPKEHCFQSIQFLFRGNMLTATATMRSCNYSANFMTDFLLTYTLANMINEGIHWSYTSHQINVIMNIGSLHIYK